ncbi:MAG: hypothetical protein Q8R37_00885, partial [Nanoarchaeota archaeon]|nr:hypothetical protein [Nanoarchaeota archaeon]
MNLLEYTDYLLEFLDISEMRKNSIQKKVKMMILEDKIRDEGQLWRNMSNLADKPVDYKEKYAQRLDHSFGNDSRFLHEIVKDVNYREPSDTSMEEEESLLSFRDALEISGCKSKDIQHLEFVLGSEALNMLADLEEENIKSNSELILERVDKITTALHDKTIWTPRIATVYFSNNELDIRYGRRRLRSEDKMKIVGLAKEGLSKTEIRKNLGFTIHTIDVTLMEVGIEAQKQKRRLPEEKILKIYEA